MWITTGFSSLVFALLSVQSIVTSRALAWRKNIPERSPAGQAERHHETLCFQLQDLDTHFRLTHNRLAAH